MNSIQRLTELLARFPGIGPKSAQRLVYYLLNTDNSYNQLLGKEIGVLQDNIKRCSRCNYFTEVDPCNICTDMQRDHSVLCVVAAPQDVEQLEASREYNGEYHVLQGYISPLRGLGPDEIGGPRLYQRVREQKYKEVILATNPTVEGETTALYLAKLLDDLSVQITRPAMGLPVGGDLGYTDRQTIARSLQDRRSLAH